MVATHGMLQINRQSLKKVDIFWYLGSHLQGDDRLSGNRRARVKAVWLCQQELTGVLCNG